MWDPDPLISLPELEDGLAALEARLDGEDRKPMPASSHAAFHPDEGHRWNDLEAAWGAIGPMYWGPRVSLLEATAVLRAFLDVLATR